MRRRLQATGTGCCGAAPRSVTASARSWWRARPGSLEHAAAGRIAVPGRETTAFLLLRLAAPALGDVVELRYDRILDAVSQARPMPA